MALTDKKLIDIDGLAEFKTKMCGWVNDKFFVGTKDKVTEEFENIPEGTFVFITDDAIDVGDLTALEPTTDDIGDLFSETDDDDTTDDSGSADDLFG